MPHATRSKRHNFNACALCGGSFEKYCGFLRCVTCKHIAGSSVIGTQPVLSADSFGRLPDADSQGRLMKVDNGRRPELTGDVEEARKQSRTHRIFPQ